MNCQEFENIIIDLARGQMMEAALRESGLAHVEACTRCALRLSDERALTAGLKALAARAENEAAPPRIEAALRAAFREPQRQMAADDRAVALAAVAFIQPPTPASHWRRWAVAAAAAILVALALAAQIWWRAASLEPIHNATVTPPTPSIPAPAPHKPAPEVAPEPKPQLVHDVRRPRGLEHAHYTKLTGSRRGTLRDELPESEIVTEFISLTYDGDLTQQEGGRVVRVLMPHSALATFGLPMNFERAAEPVKADVVVGNDGLARAIRFVQ